MVLLNSYTQHEILKIIQVRKVVWVHSLIYRTLKVNIHPRIHLYFNLKHTSPHGKIFLSQSRSSLYNTIIHTTTTLPYKPSLYCACVCIPSQNPHTYIRNKQLLSLSIFPPEYKMKTHIALHSRT